MALRQKVSQGCEKLIWDYFESGGQVVIYDANNGTRAGRHAIAEKFDKAGIHVVLLGACVCRVGLGAFLRRVRMRLIWF